MFETLKRLWLDGRLTVEKANSAYTKGLITLEELNEIKAIPR